MLKIFTKQIQRLGRDEGGQSIVFVALILIVLVCFLAVTINVGSQVSRKIQLQNAADAAVLSGATWEARGLNLIAELNRGIMGTILVMIAYVVLAGVAWFVPGLQGVAAALTCNAPYQLNKFYNIACRLSYLEHKIANFFPVVAEFEVIRIANANGARIVALPFPFIPVNFARTHESKMNLGYRLSRADMSDLLQDVADEVWRLLNRITGNALQRVHDATKWFGLDIKGKVKGAARASGRAFDFSRKGMSFAPEKSIVFGRDRYSDIEKLMAGEQPFENVAEIKDKKWYYDVQIFRPYRCDENGCPTTGSKKNTCLIKRVWCRPYRVTPRPYWFGYSFTCDDVLTLDTPIVKDFNAGEQVLDKTYEIYDTCSYSYTKNKKKVKGECRYLREKWEFSKLEVTVIEEYEVESKLALSPLKLDRDFFINQWLAVVAWDTRESSQPTFLPRFLKNTNVWGSLALAQARPTSELNRAGKIVLHSDWEARLTPFTAIDDIAEGMAGERGGGQFANAIKKIDQNIILH
jgi:hypothetical protein